MVETLLSNPDAFRQMMENNPLIQPLLERSPELRAALSDTDHLREMLRAQANPGLMREHMRNADRALSNIESLPGGFDALRRVYEETAGPMMDALQGDPSPGAQPGGRTNSGVAATANGSADDPLPNPWSGGAGAQGTAGGDDTNPFAALMGDAPGGAGGAGLGGMPLGGIPSPDEMEAILDNPFFGQMMESLASNPDMMRTMMESNPMLRQMSQANPQMRQMLDNPDLMRQMFQPAHLRSMIQLQRSLGGAMPGLAGAPATGAAAGGAPTGGANAGLAGLMGMLGGAAPRAGAEQGAAWPAGLPDLSALAGMAGGGGRGMFGGPQPVSDPETTYAGQLQQLQDMGFYDRESNIRALQSTGGNVSAAVERLLSQL